MVYSLFDVAVPLITEQHGVRVLGDFISCMWLPENPPPGLPSYGLEGWKFRQLLKGALDIFIQQIKAVLLKKKPMWFNHSFFHLFLLS